MGGSQSSDELCRRIWVAQDEQGHLVRVDTSEEFTYSDRDMENILKASRSMRTAVDKLRSMRLLELLSVSLDRFPTQKINTREVGDDITIGDLAKKLYKEFKKGNYTSEQSSMLIVGSLYNNCTLVENMIVRLLEQVAILTSFFFTNHHLCGMTVEMQKYVSGFVDLAPSMLSCLRTVKLAALLFASQSNGLYMVSKRYTQDRDVNLTLAELASMSNATRDQDIDIGVLREHVKTLFNFFAREIPAFGLVDPSDGELAESCPAWVDARLCAQFMPKQFRGTSELEPRAPCAELWDYVGMVGDCVEKEWVTKYYNHKKFLTVMRSRYADLPEELKDLVAQFGADDNKDPPYFTRGKKRPASELFYGERRPYEDLKPIHDYAGLFLGEQSEMLQRQKEREGEITEERERKRRVTNFGIQRVHEGEHHEGENVGYRYVDVGGF